MHLNHSPIIRRGPNAGQPRPISDIVLDAITAAREIAIKLRRQGVTVIGISADSGRPSVQIVAGALTRELIAKDQAIYYKHTTVRGTPERHGQCLVQSDAGHQVLLVWVEQEVH